MKTMIMILTAAAFVVSFSAPSISATRYCQPKGISTCEHGAKDGVSVPSKDKAGKSKSSHGSRGK